MRIGKHFSIFILIVIFWFQTNAQHDELLEELSNIAITNPSLSIEKSDSALKIISDSLTINRIQYNKCKALLTIGDVEGCLVLLDKILPLLKKMKKTTVV